MSKIKCIPASVTRFENVPEPTDIMGVLKFLESVGRTCYKSEDKITDESCVKFIANMNARKHRAMLEQYVFTLEIDKDDWSEFIFYMTHQNGMSDIAQKMKFIHLSTHFTRPEEEVMGDLDDDVMYLVSGSATAWNYLLEAFVNADMIGSFQNSNPVFRICEYMNSLYPGLFVKYNTDHMDEGVEYPGHCPGRKDLRLLSRAEVKDLPMDIRRVHDFMIYRMICDRGVSHEMVRMRIASPGQESTRYCNYGDRGFQMIIPCWLPESDKKILQDEQKVDEILNNLRDDPGLSKAGVTWLDTVAAAAEMYEIFLSDYEWAPQQARCVLPHSIKTELVFAANLAEWEHIFDMRVPRTAHPQMRELSIPMLRMAAEYDHEIFGAKMEELKEFMEDF